MRIVHVRVWAAHARRRRATRAQSTAPRRSGRTEAARLHSKRRRVSVSRARLEAYACGGRVAKPAGKVSY